MKIKSAIISANFIFISFCMIGLSACQKDSLRSSSAHNKNGAIENSTAGCIIPALSEYSDLKEISKLPNPFISLNGKSINSKKEWRCRRAEISAQVQKYELGEKPNAPQFTQGAVKENNLGGTEKDLAGKEKNLGSKEKDLMDREKYLLVSVDQKGKKISFTAKITLPSSGQPPYPAIIGVGGAWLNNDELSRMGVAIISFPNNEIGEQLNSSSRGKGKFFELYGSDHSASAMIAWSWGISRLIDALEKTPGANIDAKHLGVTGCSRNGKGAIVAGALDERIQLTIAQESGSGGAAGWRVSDAQLAAGQNVQTLHQIVQENVWFRESFKQFSHSATRLPTDQHSVMSLIAPRALLVIENTSMEWLGNQSAYINAIAAHEVWTALGIADSMGVSQVGGHNHCQLPASQYSDVNNFVKKFLLGDKTADTNLQKTDGSFNQDLSAWVDWKTPRLQ